VELEHLKIETRLTIEKFAILLNKKIVSFIFFPQLKRCNLPKLKVKKVFFFYLTVKTERFDCCFDDDACWVLLGEDLEVK
jgi:hypothetical protein